jgi:uncharacterized protein YcgI (DUF1989 family)
LSAARFPETGYARDASPTPERRLAQTSSWSNGTPAVAGNWLALTSDRVGPYSLARTRAAVSACGKRPRSREEGHAMAVLHDETVRINSGSAWVVKKGQRIRITFDTVMDFVCFNLHNLAERFDQARTKANQGKIWLSTGDLIYSKINTVMMSITEDTYLITALQNYPILNVDIPAPLNIGQSMDIDKDGNMTHAWVDRDRPKPGTYLELRAEMDLVCAGSADPGMGKTGRPGQPIRVQVISD